MSEREPLLDGVRGLAILLVLGYHVGIFAGLDGRTGLDAFIHVAADQLWVGVDLFFVLSGFLITGILYGTKGSAYYFRTFYGRRILRIFPLYYGFLAFAVLVFPLWLPPDASSQLVVSQGWYWLYLSNVQVALAGWQEPLHLGHFWSLAVEEQFYLVWPLAVWALDRKWLMRLAVACFAGALALRLIKPFGLTDLAAHVLLPTRMDALAAGAWLALFVRGERGLAAVGRWPAFVFGGCVVTFVALHLRPDPAEHFQSLVRAVRYTLVADACGSLLALALSRAPVDGLRRAMSAAPLVFLGRYSYGLYVVHVPIILFVASAGLDARSLPAWSGSLLPGLLLFGLVASGLSIACAVVLYHAWEEPFLRLKQHLPYRVPDPRPVVLVVPSMHVSFRVSPGRAP
jgi:peptidoglycan/LPS O-acetylase OafA/YrhL